MKFSVFVPHPRLRYGISHRADGCMNVRYRDAQQEAFAIANRKNFFEKNDLSGFTIVAPLLAHGADVFLVDGYVPNSLISDALVTQRSNTLLTISIADCFPIFLYEPRHEIIGLIHAGWQGVVKEIIPKTFQKLGALGVSPADLRVGIGPGIRACHCEMKADTIGCFSNYPEAIISREGSAYVDIPGVIRKQLYTNGVREEAISEDATCTFCASDRYFSYRREYRPVISDTMVAYIGIR